MRSAREWIDGAKRKPIPMKLLGDLWSENEIAVMFGDSGKGKSLFALQIAESIAAGRRIEPFTRRAMIQKVLYIDVSGTDKQFEMRYSRDHTGGRARYLHGHYSFTRNLIRVEYDGGAAAIPKGETSADVFCRHLRQMVAESGARVVVIDSLTSLGRSFYGMREMIENITGLRRLRKDLGLSILLLMQTPKTNNLTPLRLAPAMSRSLASRVDSIFGIGESRVDTEHLYVKQLRAGSGKVMLDSSHLPVFEIKKRNDNFLEFLFWEYAPEDELLEDIRQHKEWGMIEKIKEWTLAGKSIRQIASILNLSKTSVHKLLQMWRAPLEDDDEPNECPIPGTQPVIKPPVQKYHDFPGRKEYDAALEHPRFARLYETEDDYPLRREYSLINDAKAYAYFHFRDTGEDPPPLAEMLRRRAEERGEMDGRKGEGETGRHGDAATQECGDEAGLGSAVVRSSESEPKVQDTASTGSSVPEGWSVSVDRKGREILIEKTLPNGKPLVWYRRNAEGTYFRHKRDSFEVTIEDNIPLPVSAEPSEMDLPPYDSWAETRLLRSVRPSR